MDASLSRSPTAETSPSTFNSRLSLSSPRLKDPGSSSGSRPQGIGALGSLAGNASDVSLSNQLSGTREGLFRGRNPLTSDTGRTLSPLGRSTAQQQNRRAQHQSEADRTDALWAEMQATLAEVELSAASGTHFFGPAHSAALEELQKSQIALAQAWARSETGDEVVEQQVDVSEKSSQKSPGASVAGGGDGKNETEEEDAAESDILLARKRREANDRYFERVSKGVVDVVGRLEDVAVAMVKVEKESREIWNESESMDTESRMS